MTIGDALKEFLFQKRLSGIGENSVHNYNATISLFLCDVGADLPLNEVSYSLVADYILKLYKRPISKATMSSYIRNLRIFLRWVYVEYDLSFDPVKIKVPKSPKKNVHIYSDTEIKYIFKLVKTSVPWITARNRSIIAFMLDSGLRQFEVCDLLKSYIDKERGIMKITGKGAKDRMVPVGNMALRFMEEYLFLSPYKDSPYVFLDRRGKKLSGNAIRLFVNRLEKKLPFKLSSHKLRHNFATNYCIDHVHLTGKSDVFDLSIIMGHESIETTKKYEHFAHEIIAVENSISHLDICLENEHKTV